MRADVAVQTWDCAPSQCLCCGSTVLSTCAPLTRTVGLTLVSRLSSGKKAWPFDLPAGAMSAATSARLAVPSAARPLALPRMAPSSWLTTTEERLGATVLPLRASWGTYTVHQIRFFVLYIRSTAIPLGSKALMLRLAPGSWLTTTDERLSVTVLPPLRASWGMCTRTVLSVPHVRYYRAKSVSPAIAAHHFLENPSVPSKAKTL